MNQYEITFIAKEDTKEAPIKKEIESLDGKILQVDSLGEKQFAYKIKKEARGYYTTATFEMAPEKVLELNRQLGLKEEILRFLILTKKAAKIVLPAKEKPAIKPAAKKPTAIAPAVIPKEKPQPKIPAKPVKAAPVKIVEATELPAEIGEEERLKALDKKLDELLKE